MIKVILTYQGVAQGEQNKTRETLERWANRNLELLLSKFSGPLCLKATVKQHSKGAAKYSVVLSMRLPPKRTLVAKSSNVDLNAALTESEEKLLREVKSYKERLNHRADYRRRARRVRLRELKAQAAALPIEATEQGRSGVEPLLPRLEQVVRRELAYLHGAGELPSDYPTVQDVVDEAVLAVIANWLPQWSDEEVFRELLRVALKTLDREADGSRHFGEMLSLDDEPDKGASEQAEAMVEEEIFEFYQPDEVLHLGDALPDEAVQQPENIEEVAQQVFSLETLGGLPVFWRRVLILAEFEQLAVADIAVIVEVPPSQVEMWLEYARAFLREHLKQAGFSNGSD